MNKAFQLLIYQMILLLYKFGKLTVTKSFCLGKINNFHLTHNINVLRKEMYNKLLYFGMMFMLNSIVQLIVLRHDVNIPSVELLF